MRPYVFLRVSERQKTARLAKAHLPDKFVVRFFYWPRQRHYCALVDAPY